jgi:hypothetical protein
MKDWVRRVGLAHRHGDPTELFECPACGKQVEFAVEPQAPPVRAVSAVRCNRRWRSPARRCAMPARSMQFRSQIWSQPPIDGSVVKTRSARRS